MNIQSSYSIENCSVAVKIIEINDTIHSISIKVCRGNKKKWIIKNYHSISTNPNIVVGTIGNNFLLKLFDSNTDTIIIELQIEKFLGSIMIFYGTTKTSQILKRPQKDVH